MRARVWAVICVYCLPRRYRGPEELREKIVTAITIGQGYMALS